MTKTASVASLLHVAVQDLHAGKIRLAERLPALRDAARDEVLRTVLTQEIERAAAQAERLRATGVDVSGPANLWMAGILDDADRDARSHQPGMLLDVALVGAVRKAMAAQIVSSETAIALAGRTEQAAIGAAVEANRDEEIATDRMLKERLAALAR